MTPVTQTKAAAAAGSDSTLRAHLRGATMAAHDLLDAAMQAASGWQTRADYARFLALQHSARAPLETWLAEHAPGDGIPPPQTPLLAADLAAMGVAVPTASPAFAPGPSASESTRDRTPGPTPAPAPGTALGTAWVLAGSALGNRAIARQVARIGGGTWPSAFLDDPAMMAFWQGLRARIERPARPAEAEGAARAAAAVFAHFLAVAEAGAGESLAA